MVDRVLVTGASGFVGRAVCEYLVKLGIPVLGTVRGLVQPVSDIDFIEISDLADMTASKWAEILSDVQVVVHCAALVHQMKGVADPEAYYRVNTRGTEVLAEAAATAGVRRFVFLSTVKVLGEHTETGQRFDANSPAAPLDDYGRSKLLAEQALLRIANEADMDMVVLRLPLIYGAGVVGNFRALMNLVAKGIPLPLGAVDNRRSVLGLPNLIELLVLAVESKSRVGGVYLVSDDNDLSTPELVRGIAHSRGLQPKLFPVPVSLLRLVAAVVGKMDLVDRLCGNFQIDIEYTKEVFGWTPRYSIMDVLTEAT